MQQPQKERCLRQHERVDHPVADGHVLETEHLPEHLPPLRDGLGTEQKPQQVHAGKCAHPANRFRKLSERLLKHSLNDLQQAVHRAPEEKCEVRAVPKTADQEHDHDVHIGADIALPAAAQREVDILRKELRKRDVPPLPEVPDGGRLVRGIKVDRQVDVEHLGNTGCHIDIAAKIEVDFERVEKHCEEQIARRGGPEIGEAPKDSAVKCVGKDQLLEKTEAEQFHAARNVVPVHFLPPGIIDLRDQVDRLDHRSHDQFREVQDVSRIVKDVDFLDLLPVHADHVHDLLEREETDSERRMRSLVRASRNRPEKSPVFIKQQQPYIGCQNDSQ